MAASAGDASAVSPPSVPSGLPGWGEELNGRM